MTPYAEIWHLTRERLTEVCQDMTEEQANWRPFPGGHSTIEYLYHVAGVELYFTEVLTDTQPKDEYEKKIYAAFANTFMKEGEFPFAGSELTLEKAAAALEYTGKLFGPLIEAGDEGVLNKPLISAQGAKTDGRGAFVRAAQHSAYHTGQIYLMKCDPGYPE
ncbi:MAG TPA: DinB family protein [Fimbriimonadaceae bacterium]